MITNVSFVTGSKVTDLSVPAELPIRAWIDDVIDNLADQYRGDDVGFDFGQDAVWTITPVGSAPVQRDRSLNDADIVDGALVVVQPVTQTERYRPLAEDVIDGVAILNPDAPFGRGQLVMWLAWWAALMLSGAAAAAVYGWTVNSDARLWWGPGILGLGAGCIAGGMALWRRYDQRQVAAGLLVGGSVNVAVGAALCVPLPERATWLGASQLAGGALALLVCVLVIRGGPLQWEAWAAFVGAGSAITGLAAIGIGYGWQQYVWPAVVAVGLFVVGNAAKLVMRVARIALPPIPAVGEDVDSDELLDPVVDVAAETAGGGRSSQVWAQVLDSVPSSSARLVERSVLSQHLLAGFIAAGSAAAAVGAIRLLQQGHFLVHTLVVCALVAIVLVFRSRLPADKRCVWALLSAAAGTVWATGLTLLLWWPAWSPLIVAVSVIVTAVVLAAVAAAVDAPRMNAIRKRWLERFDRLSVAAVLPLLAWIAGLFDYLRNVPWLHGS